MGSDPNPSDDASDVDGDGDFEPPTSDSESTLTLFRNDVEEAIASFPVGAIKDGLIATVIVTGGLFILVSISGLYPPFAVVSSGSMAPNIQTGDTVYMIEESRFSDKSVDEAIVTYREGAVQDVKNHGDYGSVITFKPDIEFTKSVMHRPRFKVEEGENWYQRANEEYISSESCSELRNCPAPNTGYITKGDHNPHYDQAIGMYGPIPSDAIMGKVLISIPTSPILGAPANSGSDISTLQTQQDLEQPIDTTSTDDTVLNISKNP